MGAQFLFLTGLCIATLSCSSTPKKEVSEGLKAPSLYKGEFVALDSPVALDLKASVGVKDSMDYKLKAFSEVLQDGKPRLLHQSEVSFSSQQEVTALDTTGITAVVTTANKVGELALEDLALPEVGEKLELQYTSKGKILKAGKHAPNSIYFVPSISLPDNPVRVGESWLLDATWLSFSEGIPYRLELVSILKGWIQCSEAQPCADIELSGKVTMPGEVAPLMKFISEWKGRMIFSVERGLPLGTQIYSVETLNYDRMGRKVWTCLEGRLKGADQVTWVSPDFCAGFQPVATTPVTAQRE